MARILTIPLTPCRPRLKRQEAGPTSFIRIVARQARPQRMLIVDGASIGMEPGWDGLSRWTYQGLGSIAKLCISCAMPSLALYTCAYC